MSTSAAVRDHRVASVRVSDTMLMVELKDGREIRVPLSWFPRLNSATPEQLARWEVSAAGYGIHWPLVDEDLGVEGLLRAEPALG